MRTKAESNESPSAGQPSPLPLGQIGSQIDMVLGGPLLFLGLIRG